MGLLLVFVFIEDAGSWLRENGNLGLAVYIAVFALTSGLALLPTYAQAVLGGWAFGFALGYPAALLGFVLGSVIGYEIGRLISGDRATKIIEERRKWRAVCDALVHSGFWKTLLIVALLRAPPNSPFALTNLVLSATRTPRVIFILATAIGMAPRTIAYVMIGTSAVELTEEGLDKPWWIPAAMIVGTLIVVVVVGCVANRAVAKAIDAVPTDSGD